jgi:hypothetical protein
MRGGDLRPWSVSNAPDARQDVRAPPRCEPGGSQFAGSADADLNHEAAATSLKVLHIRQNAVTHPRCRSGHAIPVFTGMRTMPRASRAWIWPAGPVSCCSPGAASALLRQSQDPFFSCTKMLSQVLISLGIAPIAQKDHPVMGGDLVTGPHSLK